MQEFFPVNLIIPKLNVLIVGLGNVGYRKLGNILNAKSIKIISKEISNDKLEFLKNHNISYELRAYKSSDLDNIDMVFACTDDEKSQIQIRNDIQNLDRFVLANYCKINESSNFYNIAYTQLDEIGIGITTNGANPSKAKEIKEKIEKWYKDADNKNCK